MTATPVKSISSMSSPFPPSDHKLDNTHQIHRYQLILLNSHQCTHAKNCTMLILFENRNNYKNSAFIKFILLHMHIENYLFESKIQRRNFTRIHSSIFAKSHTYINDKRRKTEGINKWNIMKLLVCKLPIIKNWAPPLTIPSLTEQVSLQCSKGITPTLHPRPPKHIEAPAFGITDCRRTKR